MKGSRNIKNVKLKSHWIYFPSKTPKVENIHEYKHLYVLLILKPWDFNIDHEQSLKKKKKKKERKEKEKREKQRTN